MRAVRRALSLRRGQGGRVYDSMRQLDRRSSASLHSPPPDCANMTANSRSQVLSDLTLTLILTLTLAFTLTLHLILTLISTLALT